MNIKDKISNVIKEYRANKCTSKRTDITESGEIKRLQEQIHAYRVEINVLHTEKIILSDLLEKTQIRIKKYKIISGLLGIALVATGTCIKFL